MAIELRWIVSTSAGSLHAAATLLEGTPRVDSKIPPTLAAEIEALRHEISALGLEPSLFFEHAIPLSVRFDAPLSLAEVILVKTLGPQSMLGARERLARRLVALEAAFQESHPGALEELELRAEPIREQWDARGPGLMMTVARLTDANLIVPEADVILVHPVTGGGGAAYPPYNSVHFEAVLANPIAELPEVARLGWLLARLNLDLPKYADPLPRDRLAQIGPLAMIPPLLSAAQEVELVRCDAETLATALAAWRAPAVEPEALWQWWQTYQDSRPSWTVALAALDRMLGADSPE